MSRTRRPTLEELIRETQAAGRELDEADKAAHTDPSRQAQKRLQAAIAAHLAAYDRMTRRAEKKG